MVYRDLKPENPDPDPDPNPDPNPNPNLGGLPRSQARERAARRAGLRQAVRLRLCHALPRPHLHAVSRQQYGSK